MPMENFPTNFGPRYTIRLENLRIEYQGKPILYCAGDFIDDYAVDELHRNDQTFVFVVELEGDRVRRLLLYPTVIGEFQARRACPDEADAIANRMGGLCAELRTQATWQAEEQVLVSEP